MAPHALSLDTRPDIERRLVEGWRRMLPAEKAATLSALTTAALEMTRAGIRYRHPDEPEEMHRRKLAEILHGEARDLRTAHAFASSF